MRHLKSFRVFESNLSEDLLGTINDILLPISDSGIEYNIEDLGNIGLIHIKIHGQNQEINDCLNHLTNYLEELGHLYFVGRSIKNETHISIENNFNKEIEKDFLRIIDGIREFVRFTRMFKHTTWVNSDNYNIFKQDEKNKKLYYDYHVGWSILPMKKGSTANSINHEIDEIIRYLVGKHLKLEALTPESCSSRFMQDF